MCNAFSIILQMVTVMLLLHLMACHRLIIMNWGLFLFGLFGRFPGGVH